MFRCERCGQVSRSKEKCHKVVVETREKRYENGGFGWEIVKEAVLCEKCAKNKDICEKCAKNKEKQKG